MPQNMPLHDFYHPPILQQIIVFPFFVHRNLFFNVFFLLLLLLHSFEAIFPHCQPYKYTYISMDYGCIEVHDDDISVTVVMLLAAKFIWERWQKWMNNWNMAAPTKPKRNVRNENGPTKRKKCQPFKVKWFNLNMRKISLSFSFNFCRLLPALTVT